MHTSYSRVFEEYERNFFAAPCAFFAELAARGILARKLYYTTTS